MVGCQYNGGAVLSRTGPGTGRKKNQIEQVIKTAKRTKWEVEIEKKKNEEYRGRSKYRGR